MDYEKWCQELLDSMYGDELDRRLSENDDHLENDEKGDSNV